MRKLKVVVVGNCQARPLTMALEKLSTELEVTTVAVVHLLKSYQFHEYQSYFEQADYIVAQLVADNYPCEFVRTSFLKRIYGDKVISIVNLYFTGYTPDWFYIRIAGKAPLRGPMGDYHNKTIVESWKKGLGITEAASLILSESYNKKYANEARESLGNLFDREANADVKIGDYIQSNFSSQRLFFTFNHPNSRLIVEYAKRIVEKIGLKYESSVIDFNGKEPLSKFRPLVNPASGLSEQDIEGFQGVDFYFDDHNVILGKERKTYSAHQITKEFYIIYDRFDKYIVE